MTIKLIIKDHVNCQFVGLPPGVRRELSKTLECFLPEARYSPQYKMGRWDGKITFCSEVSSETYINCLDTLLPVLLKYYDSEEIEIEDRRVFEDFKFEEIDKFFLSDTYWPDGHPLAGEPIILSDEQVFAINNYLNNNTGIQSLPTGLGKTIITACLSKIVEAYGRSIVIVPSKSLVTQTEQDYKNVGLDVGVFYGDRKEVFHQHIITTWQSLSSLMKSGQTSEGITMADILEDMKVVICDETHSAKGKELQKILLGPFKNIQLRWGMTGTVPKEKHNRLYVTTALGELIGQVKASVLQDKGILAKCHVNILEVADRVEYADYREEKLYLTTNEQRLDWLAYFAKNLAHDTGNVLLLVENIETGKYLQNLIENSEFVHGITKNEKRAETYKDINKQDNRVLIATYGVAAVGININRLFNVILVEPGKSFIRVIQSIGRGIRVAADKSYVDIWDFTSDSKFSKRHCNKRKEYYRDVSYPYTTLKLDLETKPTFTSVKSFFSKP